MESQLTNYYPVQSSARGHNAHEEHKRPTRGHNAHMGNYISTRGHNINEHNGSYRGYGSGFYSRGRGQEMSRNVNSQHVSFMPRESFARGSLRSTIPSRGLHYQRGRDIQERPVSARERQHDSTADYEYSEPTSQQRNHEKSRMQYKKQYYHDSFALKPVLSVYSICKTGDQERDLFKYKIQKKFPNVYVEYEGEGSVARIYFKRVEDRTQDRLLVQKMRPSHSQIALDVTDQSIVSIFPAPLLSFDKEDIVNVRAYVWGIFYKFNKGFNSVKVRTIPVEKDAVLLQLSQYKDKWNCALIGRAISNEAFERQIEEALGQVGIVYSQLNQKCSYTLLYSASAKSLILLNIYNVEKKQNVSDDSDLLQVALLTTIVNDYVFDQKKTNSQNTATCVELLRSLEESPNMHLIMSPHRYALY